MAALGVAGSGLAADGLSPASVSLTLSPGGSADVAKTLHVDALPPKADVVLAFDTTASMGAALDAAKAEATAIVTDVQAQIAGARFAVVDFRDYGGTTFDPSPSSTDYPYELDQALTSSAAAVTTAIGNLTLGDGGDAPEAYNTVFYEAYSDPALQYASGAEKILIVLGDQVGHDPAQTETFSSCASTTPVDPGPPAVGVLPTKTVLDGLVAHKVALSFVSFNDAVTHTEACHQQLAGYTGGSDVAAGSTGLAAQIVGLVQAAAKRIGGISFTTAAVSAPAGAAFDPSAWVSFTGLPKPPPDAPADVGFRETVTAPPGTAIGSYAFDVHALVDGADRAVEHVTVDVRDPVSNVTMSADETSVPAGIASLPLASVPAGRIPYLAGDLSSTPVGSIPVGSIPVGSIPVGSIPVGSIPVGSIPVGSIGFGATPVGSIPVGSIGLQSVLLSQLPLGGGKSWSDVVCPPLGTQPPQTITLADVAADATTCGTPAETSWQRFSELPLRDAGIGGLLAGVHLTSLLLGNATLAQLPPPGGSASWAAALAANGGSADGVDPGTNTVFGVDLGGKLGSTPVGSIPVGSIPVGSIPVGSIPVGSIAARSRLGRIAVSDISPATDIVTCAGSCATLGDAAAANAIAPGATLALLRHDLSGAGASLFDSLTVNELAAALVPVEDLPWQNLPVQGFQDVAGTGKNVHYHVSADVDCGVASLARGLRFAAALPAGFFVKAGSSTLTVGGGAAQSVPDPTYDGETKQARWTTVPAGACGDATGVVHAQLSFESYAGLELGRKTASATVSVFSVAKSVSGQAAVTVTQNREPDDAPTTASPLAQNVVVVGHIAVSGDQDFYRLPLDGLPRGTRIQVFLGHVPDGADFDLTVSKPSAAGFSSTPVGSIPVGSIPIEDQDPTAPLGSETLQDVPVGSIPVGSIPVGSIPVGSISANRGSAPEAAQIVTTGETGDAIIGVSGYNGSSSSDYYQLLVREIAPPPLPPSCPARTFPNPVPAPGTLPASLPTTTKTLFVVDRQRLSAMYGADKTQSLLTTIAGSLATRPEVAGAVVAVDGSAAVRTAYGAWDQSPCSVDRANDVVRAIGDVIASYRNSAGGLPNLRYVVLLGNDEALPMLRYADPVQLSPETDEAADLAFTTAGLTAGNALYTAAAQDNLLTDAPYGSFTSVPWLGHDLPLAQVAVSRLVESPDDMLGQIGLYLSPAVNGKLDPATGTVTGYDFLADGADAVEAGLQANFAATSFGSLIQHPGDAPPFWDAAALQSAFFSAPKAIGALNAHYNHWELQPANGQPLVTDSAVTANPGAILFTMGCHAGLNVSDGLGGDPAKLHDWAQAYAQAKAAVYVANSGFGYGDTQSVALSERLMALFARNLRSDSGAIGDQWVNAVQTYFATAGAYDVYDEKVLTEATLYGLPFWHFATSPATPAPTRLTTSADPVTGTQAATVSLSMNPAQQSGPNGTTFWSADGRTSFGLYRPLQPIVSKEVTSSLPARGIWIRALQTQDVAGISPTVGLPTIDLGAHEARGTAPPPFYPALPLTLETSDGFGSLRSFVNMTGQFRPSGPDSSVGTQRNLTSATLQVFYSQSADRIAPLISSVSVAFAGGTATIRARITDDAEVAEAAALVNDGSWHYVQLQQSPDDPTLWQASTSTASDPEVIVEATDGVNVSTSANKGSNFTSATSAPTGPQILVKDPSGPYALNQPVTASYSCGGAATCDGTVANGAPLDTSSFGVHTFVVRALAGDGTVLATLQRTYVVEYLFRGFFPPVADPPVLNTVKAGSAIPVKFSLGGNQGLSIFADGYPRSQEIACDASAPADGLDQTVTAGASSLQYDSGSDQYTYVWKTSSSWAGSCRALVLKTSDGLVHRADFKFK